MNFLAPYDLKDLCNGMEKKYASCGHDSLSLLLLMKRPNPVEESFAPLICITLQRDKLKFK